VVRDPKARWHAVDSCNGSNSILLKGVGLVDSDIVPQDDQHACHPALLDMWADETIRVVALQYSGAFRRSPKHKTLAGQAGQSRQQSRGLKTWSHDDESLEIDDIVKPKIGCYSAFRLLWVKWADVSVIQGPWASQNMTITYQGHGKTKVTVG
jgi:hypothetical protein